MSDAGPRDDERERVPRDRDEVEDAEEQAERLPGHASDPPPDDHPVL